MCYYCDIHCGNFPIDRQGQLRAIDFNETGVLPASFIVYGIRGHPLQRLKNLRAMGKATYVLKTVHNIFRKSLPLLTAPSITGLRFLHVFSRIYPWERLARNCG